MSARQGLRLAWLAALPLMAGLGLAQSQVDLRTQAKDVDFSAYTFTRPVETGSTLPVNCSVGQLFYNTAAAPGQNLYACTSNNTWTVETGGGGGAAATCGVQWISGTTLTIFPTASVTTPCIFGRGTTSSFISAPATLTAGPGTAVMFISVGAGGVIQVGAGSGAVTCSGCVASTATAFAADGKPVFTWTLTNGAFDQNGGTDMRAVLDYKPSPVSGRGISVTAGDQDTIATDGTVIPAKFSGSGAPGAVGGSSLGDTYVNSATGDFYVCGNASANCSSVGAGQWTKVNGTQTIASGAQALATSAIASGTCTGAQTATATGTLTTDTIVTTFAGDPTAATGFLPSTSGMLTIVTYPAANAVNFKVCNTTGSSITPGAVTVNWRVVR